MFQITDPSALFILFIILAVRWIFFSKTTDEEE